MIKKISQSILARVTSRHQARKGSAILIAILMVTVLATIAFSVGQITYADIKMAAGIEDASIAYHAAEAGIEDGLLRWRYNHNIETPTVATNVNRIDLSGDNGGSVNNGIDPKTPLDNPEHTYYDLRISYRQEKVGDMNNIANSPYTLAQDEVLELAGDPEAAAITVTFKYVLGSTSNTNYYLSIRVYNEDGSLNEANSTINDITKLNAQIANGIQITIPKKGKARIKPWNIGLKYAMQADAGHKVDSGETLIESTGHYGSVKRKLVARINRKSGQIIGIYDFVLFSGTGNISSQ